jgi:hypothetical protein
VLVAGLWWLGATGFFFGGRILFFFVGPAASSGPADVQDLL